MLGLYLTYLLHQLGACFYYGISPGISEKKEEFFEIAYLPVKSVIHSHILWHKGLQESSPTL